MSFLAAEVLKPHDITVLLISLAALLGLARILGETARAFKQPAVLGEILAGIALGPTLLGFFFPEAFAWLYPEAGTIRVADEGVITLCATLLLLVVGLEVDLSTVWRQGKAMLLVSGCGIVIPFGVGFSLAYAVPEFLGIGPLLVDQSPLPFAIFVGISLSITALPVIAKILMDLNLARSDFGLLIISSAMLNDVVGWIGFAVVLALIPAGTEAVEAVAHAAEQASHAEGGPGIATTIIFTLLFLAFMLTIGRWICHYLMVYVQAHWSWPGGVLALVFVIGLLCAAFTSWLGIHSIFGAFIAGVAIGDSHHLTERTRDTIHQFVTNLFAPIFFASIGLRINFFESFDLFTVVTVFIVALIGKVGGCVLGAKLAGMSKRESWAVAFGMAAQGAVGIILGQLAYQAGLIQDELMVAIVIMALGTSLLSGPAIQRVLNQKTKRKLTSFISDRHIVVTPTSRNVDETIEELAVRAAEVTGLDQRLIADAVAARERIMHTGMPGGLAVPHARLATLTKPTIIIARHADGVDFDSPDGELARLICMLLTPSDDPDSQIELLSLVAGTFGDADIRARCLRAASATEFRASLNLAESTPDQHLTPKDGETLGAK